MSNTFTANVGTLAGDSSVDLSVGGTVDNSNGTVSAVGALNANVAGTLNNTSGKLLGNGAATVVGGSLNNTLGSMQSSSGATQLAKSTGDTRDGLLGLHRLFVQGTPPCQCTGGSQVACQNASPRSSILPCARAR